MGWHGPMSWRIRASSGKSLPTHRMWAGFWWHWLRLINVCNCSGTTVFDKPPLVSPGDISGPRATGKTAVLHPSHPQIILPALQPYALDALVVRVLARETVWNISQDKL